MEDKSRASKAFKPEVASTSSCSSMIEVSSDIYKSTRAQRAKKQKETSSSATDSSDIELQTTLSSTASDSLSEVEEPISIDVSKISAAAVRYGVSNRATAAISTATLAAAKEAGLLVKSHIIDHDKIKTCKNKIMKEAREKRNLSTKESDVLAILFDGRKDNTKCLMLKEDGKFHSTEKTSCVTSTD